MLNDNRCPYQVHLYEHIDTKGLRLPLQSIDDRIKNIAKYNNYSQHPTHATYCIVSYRLKVHTFTNHNDDFMADMSRRIEPNNRQTRTTYEKLYL